MKQHFKCVYDDIENAITFAKDQELPLESIELSPQEWILFINDHRFDDTFGWHAKIALRQPGYKQIMFKEIKVFTHDKD